MPMLSSKKPTSKGLMNASERAGAMRTAVLLMLALIGAGCASPSSSEGTTNPTQETPFATSVEHDFSKGSTTKEVTVPDHAAPGTIQVYFSGCSTSGDLQIVVKDPNGMKIQVNEHDPTFAA